MVFKLQLRNTVIFITTKLGYLSPAKTNQTYIHIRK